MTAALLFLMPYELVGRAAHEWIGTEIFLLFILHHILNRKWTAHMFKGKYTKFRILQTILVAAIFISMIGYLIYFDGFKSDDFINSPYNTRQDSFSDRVVRGKILSSDGQVLAQTNVSEDGTFSDLAVNSCTFKTKANGNVAHDNKIDVWLVITIKGKADPIISNKVTLTARMYR